MVGLLFLLGALVAAILWLELSPVEQRYAPNAEIQKISIKRDGHDTIVLDKNAGVWTLTAPFKLNANAVRIEPLLTLIPGNETGYSPAEVDMAATGLLDSTTSITLNNETIKLGKPGTDGDRRYALINEQVFLLPEWVWSLVHGGVTAFADLTVFTDLPDTLYLHPNDGFDNPRIYPVSARAWRNLQADKIIPKPKMTQPSSYSFLTRFHVSTSESDNAQAVIADVARHQKYSVIWTQGKFAYVISHEKLDELMQ